ncbi:PAAR domain-containing protein [Pseudomonas sp. CGJS7]|uniref:PAAR domain-containing protein n=1 Tax=Pseudomonas sp. CGJS7 TaxID=3109348 RepID=UPI0030087438
MVGYWIVVGDTTSGGGRVLGSHAERSGDAGNVDAASGMAWARLGDAVQCGAHGLTSIVTGDSEHLIDGRAVARHGDFCACGCILISRTRIRSIAELGGSFAAAREVWPD